MSQDKIKYNPKIHHRRSIRLKGYDYSQAGAYFITICTNERKCLFGEVTNGEMMLNDYGKIAYNEWNKLPERFPNFELDVFQVMPNHVHGIIVLNESVGARFTRTHDDNRSIIGARFTPARDAFNNDERPVVNDVNKAGTNPASTETIGDIVGVYKSLVANECLKIFKLQWAGASPAPTMGKIWQRNYHEHIIRNEQSYQTISNYIMNNPANWGSDKFFI